MKTDTSATRLVRAERYGRWVVKWRWPVLVTALALSFLATAGARRLGFIDEYRVFFGPDNPQLLAFDAVEAIYTKNDNILMILEPPDGEAFTNQTLAIVEEMTAEAWKIPFAIRVDSLSNFQHSWAEGDNLIVEDLVRDAEALTPEELSAKREIALTEPMLLNRIVPSRTHVVGLNITLQLPRKETDETARSVAFARELAARVEEENPGFKTHITGMAMLNNAFQKSAMKDMATLVPAMYLVITLTIVLLLRSVSATITTLGVIALSVTSALGLAGWAGLSLTAALTIIMTLAVADAIHILVTMLKEMRHGATKHQAVVESLRVNMQPVFLTSLTTAIGFLSMNFSEVPPFHDLGNISATGVAAAWVLSITLLPALMAILPVKVKLRAERTASTMDKVADFVVSRRRPLLWGGGLVALLMAALLPLNTLNDQFVNYFDESMAFRQDSDFAMEHLSGIYQIDFSLGADSSGGISEPAYLKKIDEFANWYRAQSGVVHVASLSDVFKKLNKNLNADEPSYYRLPENRELAAQYLLLYEMSLPYGLDLNNQINVDKSATKLSVTVQNITSRSSSGLWRPGRPGYEATLRSTCSRAASAPV